MTAENCESACIIDLGLQRVEKAKRRFWEQVLSEERRQAEAQEDALAGPTLRIVRDAESAVVDAALSALSWADEQPIVDLPAPMMRLLDAAEAVRRLYDPGNA